jgi:hypothetical protein
MASYEVEYDRTKLNSYAVAAQPESNPSNAVQQKNLLDINVLNINSYETF